MTIANLRRFQFLIPASLASGTYSVWVSGSVPSAFNTLSTPSCSSISVTATTTTLAACVPTSSLAVVAGANVTAYVPFGYWESNTPGIERVPLEGSGTTANFATANGVNSCAANSVTGEVVCTENNTNVDLINGSTLTTLTSGANQPIAFSGRQLRELRCRYQCSEQYSSNCDGSFRWQLGRWSSRSLTSGAIRSTHQPLSDERSSRKTSPLIPVAT